MPFIFIFYSEHLENTAPICQKYITQFGNVMPNEHTKTKHGNYRRYNQI